MAGVKDYVFYYPIHVTAKSLKEAREELSLNFELDPIMIHGSDLDENYIKFLKTKKASRESKKFYFERIAEEKAYLEASS